MDLFDILGPVMIGPSSSHTAGAARIGRVARRLFGRMPEEAVIELSGSFAMTWQGHGIDRAILGGLMDLAVDDERLRDSRALADRAGLRYRFEPVSLPDTHPNTARLTLKGAGEKLCVTAASIGGGRIRVTEIDGLEVGFSGDMPTLIIGHRDEPGVIADVSRLLADAGLNIASMRVFRAHQGGDAAMAIELDARPDPALVKCLTYLHFIHRAVAIDKI